MNAIEFDNVGKQYRLGLVSTGTISHDLNRWWTMNVLRKEDPYLKIGEANDRSHKGESEYVWALNNINFKVEEGDVVGIIGKNGAGKSTLLKLLSRVTSPTTGYIRARGRIASLLEVGTGFHPEMTGRENIYMNGAIMGMTKAEISRKLDEIIDFSGCERYIDTPIKRFSSGMTVRLGFAVAAFLEPEILVVDEVLAVGDAEFQKKAIGKMKEVSQGGGRTVLFVSHNMASVRALCKHGVLLKNGCVDYVGEINDVINYYTGESLKKDGSILENIEYNCNDVIIKDITVNGCSDRVIYLTGNNNDLVIEVHGLLKRQLPLSMELIITDINATPLMTYSTSYGNSPIFPAGKFLINENVHLPSNINGGSYLCNIYFTNSGKQGYVDIPSGLYIDVEGTATPTGNVLMYSSGVGLLHL